MCSTSDCTKFLNHTTNTIKDKDLGEIASSVAANKMNLGWAGWLVGPILVVLRDHSW